MNLINNDKKRNKLELTQEKDSNAVQHTISLLTRKVNELNNDLNNKINNLENKFNAINIENTKNINYIKSEYIKNKSEEVKEGKSDSEEGESCIKEIEKEYENNNVIKLINDDINIVKLEISKLKNYTLDIYNEVIKMRSVIEGYESFNKIQNDLSNWINEINETNPIYKEMNNSNIFFPNLYEISNINDDNNLENDTKETNEWIRTQSILNYLQI